MLGSEPDVDERLRVGAAADGHSRENHDQNEDKQQGAQRQTGGEAAFTLHALRAGTARADSPRPQGASSLGWRARGRNVC
jgi:hypothetical protein